MFQEIGTQRKACSFYIMSLLYVNWVMSSFFFNFVTAKTALFFSVCVCVCLCEREKSISLAFRAN